MLAKPFRLITPSEFKAVRENGTFIKTSYFGFCYLNRNDTNPSRFGFVIPTKVVPRAVDRNRIRRVLSEATRFELTHIKPGFDCVYLANMNLLRAYTDDVLKEVRDAFGKAGMLNS